MTEQLKRYRMHSPDGVAGAMTDMVLASDHAAAVAALEKERDLANEAFRIKSEQHQALERLADRQSDENAALTTKLNAALAWITELWKHCHVTYWPSDGSYPIEHNQHAKKDMRAAIEAALSQEKRGE